MIVIVITISNINDAGNDNHNKTINSNSNNKNDNDSKNYNADDNVRWHPASSFISPPASRGLARPGISPPIQRLLWSFSLYFSLYRFAYFCITVLFTLFHVTFVYPLTECSLSVNMMANYIIPYFYIILVTLCHCFHFKTSYYNVIFHPLYFCSYSTLSIYFSLLSRYEHHFITTFVTFSMAFYTNFHFYDVPRSI